MSKRKYTISNLQNTIGMGDALCLLKQIPANSIDLIFTSPPYYNARPEYAEYKSYEDYLRQMENIFQECKRVLVDGRFLVINASPVLIPRASRNQSSTRIAIPFDLHNILIKQGYDFIDDIIWIKPEGAGWATNRGLRFAADRNPLQYKTVPITEYVLVYRKHTDLLIDWFIRKHPDREKVRASKILGKYERTNVWYINPNTKSWHPAAFPDELAEKIIRYYSFVGDVVLDPFAGSGTVGKVAAAMGRRFVLFDYNADYIKKIEKEMMDWDNVIMREVQKISCVSK